MPRARRTTTFFALSYNAFAKISAQGNLGNRLSSAQCSNSTIRHSLKMRPVMFASSAQQKQLVALGKSFSYIRTVKRRLQKLERSVRSPQLHFCTKPLVRLMQVSQ